MPPHLTLDKVWEFGQKAKVGRPPLTYTQIQQWVATYPDSWYNLAAWSVVDGWDVPWLEGLVRVLVEARDAGLLRGFIEHADRNESIKPNANLEWTPALSTSDRLLRQGVHNLSYTDRRWLLVNVLIPTFPRGNGSWPAHEVRGLIEMDLSALEFSAEERARYMAFLDSRVAMEDEQDEVAASNPYEAPLRALLAKGVDDVEYSDVVAAIDAVPAESLGWLIPDIFTTKSPTMKQRLIKELIVHGDYERLAKIWTDRAGENSNTMKFAQFLGVFLIVADLIIRWDPDAPAPWSATLSAIDFLLAKAVNNPNIGPHIPVETLVSVEQCMEAWLEDVPLAIASKRWKVWTQSLPYPRIVDLILAQEYTRKVVANNPRLRRVIARHIFDNQRLPDIVEWFRGAVHTTRPHFFYRGIDTHNFDTKVAAPVSVTWDLRTAEKFTRAIGAKGLIMVVRVPAGVPIVAIVPDAEYEDSDDNLVMKKLVEDDDYKEKEIILPSFATLSEVSSDGNARADFVEQWYDYRYKSDVFYEQHLSQKLVFVDYTFVSLGLAKRLRQRAPDVPYLPNYDPADTMTDAMRRL